MHGYTGRIDETARGNTDFRRVLYTAKSLQLVVMTIPVGGEIGEEVHDLDQFIRVEEGSGVAVLDGVEWPITTGSAVLVPAGTKHNVRTVGTEPLKLSTLYAPPEHRDGVVQHTRPEAELEEEHFDGVTTE